MLSTPNGKVAGGALREQDMDVWVPFQVPTESVEHAYKTGGKIFGFVHLIEHTQDNVADSIEKAVQQFAVLAKKGRSSSGMVKTQWRCRQWTSLKDMAEERRIE